MGANENEMEIKSSNTWAEANQCALSAALAVVRSRLSYAIARSRDENALLEVSTHIAEGQELYLQAARYVSPQPALETLCGLFGLSSFERDVLLVCAGMELDAGFAALCATAHGDPQRPFPTFGLMFSGLPEAHWSALSPDRPLRKWRLIEFAALGGSGAAPLTTRPLRIDERVLNYLIGVHHLDQRLEGLVERLYAPEELTPTQSAVAEQVAEVWLRAVERSPLPVIFLHGPDASALQSVAASACVSLGVNLHAIAAHALPNNPSDVQTLIRLWEREAGLTAGALLLECEDDEARDAVRDDRINDFVQRMQGSLIVASRERRRFGHRHSISFEVRTPTVNEQRLAWNLALGDCAKALNGELDQLVSQFSLNIPAIHSAAVKARVSQDPSMNFDALWDACRDQTRSGMEGLAQHIEPAASWDDMVLPNAQKDVLGEIVVHVQQRAKVYGTWGFAAKGARGLGISALFAGASGTGKTMAAEVLARKLRLDLYRIDLSSVVSKYIGETEKNLRRVFDAAESGGAILLFDEADALFGKRSEVKDSHDRYANIEVSYLLQRMECYRGLAILTTNMKSALDAAFLRRIRFIVQFPFSHAEQRVEIWRRVFPSETPTEFLDIEKLAQLNVSGGNIRNIALNSAFAAADANDRVRMSHLLHAAHSEYAKLDKSLSETEIAGWTGKQTGAG